MSSPPLKLAFLPPPCIPHPHRPPLPLCPATSCTSAPPASLHPHPLLTDRAAQAAFLRAHWNRRPALLRNLFPAVAPPLTPSELAGLSLHPSSSSRLVLGAHPDPLALRLGPFTEADFAALPSTNWTLLVHDAQRHVPDLVRLQDALRLLPAWRADDVMVSYATRGGGVGPHVDNYDVFLVQGKGRRVWKVGGSVVGWEEEERGVVEGSDVRVLGGDVEWQYEWHVGPGDAVYVPPRFAHEGVAEDDECMTFSVGFRAPERGDLVRAWVEEGLGGGSGGKRTFFKDGVEDLVRGLGDGGRISEEAVHRAYEMVVEGIRESDGGRERFRDWFAREMSRPKRAREEGWLQQIEEEEVEEMLVMIEEGGEEVTVRQQEGCTFAYTESADGVFLYADGERWHVEKVESAALLCGARIVPAAGVAELMKNDASMRELVRQLLAAELMYVDDGLPVEEDESDQEDGDGDGDDNDGDCHGDVQGLD